MEDSNHLMTVGDFNLSVEAWAGRIVSRARRSLGETRSSGSLSGTLGRYVDRMAQDEPAYKVAFAFRDYGVFRAYGAGRGYVVTDGTISRGYRVRSARDIETGRFSLRAQELRRQGYTTRQVNSAKVAGEGAIARRPLDWIDRHIDTSINALADTVQEYYGDDALRQMLSNLNQIKINKHG